MKVKVMLCMVVFFTLLPASPLIAASVLDIAVKDQKEYTSVIVKLDGSTDFTHEILKEPFRIVMDFKDTEQGNYRRHFLTSKGKIVQRVRLGQREGQVLRMVIDLHSFNAYTVSTAKDPFLVAVRIYPPGKKPQEEAPPAQHEAGHKEEQKEGRKADQKADQEVEQGRPQLQSRKQDVSFRCRAQAGKFAVLTGRVDVLPQGKLPAVQVAPESPVCIGDLIRTRSNSAAALRFSNGAGLKIATQCRVTVVEYKEESSSDTVTVNIRKGMVEALSPAFVTGGEGVKKKNIFIMTTLTPATAKAEDEYDYIVNVHGNTTEVLVKTGAVMVLHDKMPDKPVQVSKGEGTAVNPESAPLPPQKTFVDEGNTK